MKTNQSTLDKSVFLPTVLISAIIGLCFIFATDDTQNLTLAIDKLVKNYLGWLFLIFGLGALFFALWLAFSRYGHVKLGAKDEKPEFSTPHWVAMMFTAGIGAGLVTWAFGEPLYYIQDPPLGIEPMSSEAFEWAHLR